MQSRSLKLSLVAVPLAAAAILLPAQPASADSSAAIRGARATFASENEVFRLYDTECDGTAVYLRVYFPIFRTFQHSGGCNTNSTLNLSYAEGAEVEYQVCVGSPTNTVRCSGRTEDIA